MARATILACWLWLASIVRKPTIYPELIEPGDWEVDEWTPEALSVGLPPCTDIPGRRMLVPAGNSALGVPQFSHLTRKRAGRRTG